MLQIDLKNEKNFFFIIVLLLLVCFVFELIKAKISFCIKYLNMLQLHIKLFKKFLSVYSIFIQWNKVAKIFKSFFRTIKSGI